MIHFPILKSTNANSILEFSHFDMDALAGTWKKENIIMRNSLKINGRYGVQLYYFGGNSLRFQEFSRLKSFARHSTIGQNGDITARS